MPRELQRGGEGGPDTAGADDSDGQPGGSVLSLGGWLCIHAAMAFRSSPRGVPDDSSPCYASVSGGLQRCAQGETGVSRPSYPQGSRPRAGLGNDQCDGARTAQNDRAEKAQAGGV
ncbi:hypothetical protein Stsp01_63550 [Streptomyces sp. NBRC 13847]|nr:hypothetical protein Stsp01_63550 [Streptomyces sp. NBRC 13847]